MSKYFMVCGCGRSGTHYLTDVFRNAGLDVSHETWDGNDGVVSTAWAGDPHRTVSVQRKGTYVAYPPKFDVVLHVVRHPLDCIASNFYRWKRNPQTPSWNYVRQMLCLDALTGPDVSLEGVMFYWYRWNLICKQRSIMTFRIEKTKERWPEICKWIGIDPIFTDVGANRSGDEHPDLTWQDLQKANPIARAYICQLARGCGYAV